MSDPNSEPLYANLSGNLRSPGKGVNSVYLSSESGNTALSAVPDCDKILPTVVSITVKERDEVFPIAFLFEEPDGGSSEAGTSVELTPELPKDIEIESLPSSKDADPSLDNENAKSDNAFMGEGTEPHQEQDSEGAGGLSLQERGLSYIFMGAVRRSMRRMQRFRLSGGHRGPRNSAETEERRQIPAAPQVGLPTVRSPPTSAILLSSLLATLDDGVPRETLESISQGRGSHSAAPRPSSPDDGPPAWSDLYSPPPPSSTRYAVPPPVPFSASSSGIGYIPPPMQDARISAGPIPTISAQVSMGQTRGPSRRPASSNGIPIRERAPGTGGGATRRPRRRPQHRQRPSSSDSNNNQASAGRTTTGVSQRPEERARPSNNENRTPTQPSQHRPRSESQNRRLFRLRVWGHNHSGLMASLAVLVTPFNISRFAVLGAVFGWPFVVQWLVVSIVLGLPLMSFHAAVGQHIGAGALAMWRVSPIFQGVGISILLCQMALGLYCSAPIAWLFVYFRESFVTYNSMFRWADCRLINCTTATNFSEVIIQGPPKFFISKVLQQGENTSLLEELASLKFDLAFNSVVIWVITFVALSRGIRSYGKICYFAFLIPLLCYLVVCLYIASWNKDDLYINHISNFGEIFMNSKSWMAASREVFLVWGLHGSVIQQMAANNRKGHSLYRDTSVMGIITVLTLVLAAVTGSSCVSGLYHHQFNYKPSSFETQKSAQFLSVLGKESKPTDIYDKILELLNMKPPVMHSHVFGTLSTHDNFYVGIRIRPFNSDTRKEADTLSGYQGMRLATELFPALLAVNRSDHISPFWGSLFYLSLLLFGIAYQLAIWRTIVQAIITINLPALASWEVFITFCCCVFGFSISLPLTTGVGIHILYFLDYVFSCGWWLMIIQLIQVFALLFVRGKPYSSQDLASELMGKNDQCRAMWLGPLTSFAWSILVPVGLLVLSITTFKSGDFRERVQQLYRPNIRMQGQRVLNDFDSEELVTEHREDTGNEEEVEMERPYSDPPPKYTPPPSYSTATGLRLAKMINQGIRRSMRRIQQTIALTMDQRTEADSNRAESASSSASCSGAAACSSGSENAPESKNEIPSFVRHTTANGERLTSGIRRSATRLANFLIPSNIPIVHDNSSLINTTGEHDTAPVGFTNIEIITQSEA